MKLLKKLQHCCNICGLAILAFLFFLNPVEGQTQRKMLRVGTKPFAPFAFESKGEYIGFSIDLWREIAQSLEIDYVIYGEKTVIDLLDSVSYGQTDIAIAGITITAKREEQVDFSFPFFESGLQILVPYRSSSPVLNFLSILFSPILLEAIALLLLIIIIAAHLIWWMERQKNTEMFPKNYLAGLWEACWWAVVTLVTVGYGDKVPKSVVGRILATIWMFTGILLVSYFTASVTSVLTVQRLATEITGPKDLAGKRVATVKGSTAATYLGNLAVNVIEFDLAKKAFKALEEKEVDAVVYDAPVLLNYVNREGAGKAQVVGPLFEKQSYGIALKHNSIYREPINQALLTLMEDGTYTEIYQKWFGDSE